jgi:hypothetical protein
VLFRSQGAKADTALQTETDPTVPAWAKAASKPTYTPAEVGAATAVQGAKADTALQTETDPTVPAWAKAASKPTYTPAEVGAATAAQGAKADTALQTETDPTVPAWAKAASKPTYTASEVGAVASADFNNCGGVLGTIFTYNTATVTLSARDKAIIGDSPSGKAFVASWNAAQSIMYGAITARFTSNTAGRLCYEYKAFSASESTAIGGHASCYRNFTYVASTGVFTVGSEVYIFLAGQAWANATFATKAQGTKADSAYQKPATGIPKTDLESAAQTSLGKADTAVQTETDPTVPTWAKAASKPTYAYSEISGTPTIPTSLPTPYLLTFTGGVTVTWNGSAAKSVAIPTTLPASDVYAWAKAANKPTYTASEVGAQETLVNGTNIKTVNGNSLLGSGDLPIGDETTRYLISVAFRMGSNLESGVNFYNGFLRWAVITETALAAIISYVNPNGAEVIGTSENLKALLIALGYSGTVAEAYIANVRLWTTEGNQAITSPPGFTASGFTGVAYLSSTDKIYFRTVSSTIASLTPSSTAWSYGPKIVYTRVS